MAENFSLTNPPVRVFFLEETNVVRWLLGRTCGISGGSYLETREWEGCISKEGKERTKQRGVSFFSHLPSSLSLQMKENVLSPLLLARLPFHK